MVCARNNQFEFAVASIQAIRSKIQSNLPIQIFHMGDEDLSVEKQDYLQKMTTDVETVDIRDYFDNGYIQLKG